MGYIQDFERELRARLAGLQPGREPEDFIRFVKQEVLKSYRNGIEASLRAKQEKKKIASK